MAHIRLDIGADRSASLKTMREDLSAIVDALNKEPKLKQIKLGFDMAGVSKDVNTLKTKINELRKDAAEIKFSDQISTSLSGITTNLKTLTDSVSGVSGLRDALQSLSEAMRSFHGINLNLGLSGNSINRNAAYGNAARSAIVELERQITAIEQAYARFYNMTDARSAAFRGATSVFGINTAIETRDALGAGNLNEQVTALTRYISMLQVAANHINGLDLSPVNAQFEHTATEIMHNVERVANGEVELNNNTERLRGIFSSGINAEALNEQLNTISASISNASNAMGALGLNEESLNSFRAAINEIVELINQLIASVEKVNTTVSGLAPRDIVNRDSLEQAVATVNEATQATQVLGNTMGATASRAQEVTKAAQDVATATRGNVAASNELNTSISNLGTTMQAIEDTRIQEIANAELLREAQAEEEAYTNRANTALQNQIDMMLGIGRETKSAEQSMEAFIAVEDEANRTFQNIRTAEPQLKKIADAATKARTLLNSNMEASESPSYQKAITSLERLEIVMEACGTDASNLHRVLRDTGINSTFEIERLNSAVSTLKNELLNTGTEGSVSLRNIIDTFNKMQTRLNRNTGLTGGNEYSELAAQAESFRNVISNCATDESNLLEVMRRFGLDGAAAIENARLAMSRFDTAVINSPRGINISLRNIVDTLNQMRSLVNSNRDITGNALNQVSTQITTFQNIINECGGDATRLEAALNKLGLDSTTVIENARLAMSNFRTEAIETVRAKEEAIRTFANPDAAEAELKRITQATTSARKLLSSNIDASNSDSYQRVIQLLGELDRLLKECGRDSSQLASAISTTGLDSTEYVNRLNTAVSTLKDELQTSGTSGTTSLQAIIHMLNQMQSLVGRNTNVVGGTGYAEITAQISQFQNIVSKCNGDTQALEQVLRNMSINGSSLIENARLAMENYRTEVIQATNDEIANADATRAAEAARRKEEKTIRAGENAYRQYASVALQAETKLRQWSAAEHSANQESRNAYANLYSSVSALDAAARAYDGTEDSARNLAAAVQNTRTTLKESERMLKANGEATQTFGDRLKGLAQKFSAWLSVSQVIMYAVRTVRKMISTSVELDSAMSQMRIVTNATESDMKRFGDTVAETAKRIGASMTDLIDSATVFARLGYSLDESSSLAEYTSMLQKVGDIDVSDAQNAITAITKAYDDIDADNIESTMDKLVKVGNSFPISTAEIAEGLNNAASSLSAAGNTFEESVALLTAANTTVDYCRAA